MLYVLYVLGMVVCKVVFCCDFDGIGLENVMCTVIEVFKLCACAREVHLMSVKMLEGNSLFAQTQNWK